jgi:hypothetical protein
MLIYPKDILAVIVIWSCFLMAQIYANNCLFFLTEFGVTPIQSSDEGKYLWFG